MANKTPAAKKATKQTSPRKPAPAVESQNVKPHAGDAKAPTEKVKRIRDEFAMPKDEYEGIAKLKATAGSVGVKVKKNELIRLGLRALQRLSPKDLGEAIVSLQTVTAKKAN